MTIPDPITVTGTVKKLDGTPETGKVVFRARYFLQSPSQSSIVSPGVISVDLDTNGHFSVSLPATNDTLFTPNPWSYEVKVHTSGGVKTSEINVDANAAGSTVDLSSIWGTDTVTTPVYYIQVTQKGQPNGVASLDGTGKVPAGQLPASGGGIPASIVTTKGDLIVATASATLVRKGIGANGTFLKADSTQTDGQLWATIAESDVAGLVTDLSTRAVSKSWNGSSYTALNGQSIYVGTGTPPSPADGDIWFDTTGL